MREPTHDIIVILDFGSQYTQLIARRVRESGVFCEIVPYNRDLAPYRDRPVRGYILSGGPASLSDPKAPRVDESFFATDKPILGICYGMQLLAREYGGDLVRSDSREYGRAWLTTLNGHTPLFAGLPERSQVWMSHGDSITRLPDGFELIGSTESLATAAMADVERGIYGLQFHPEVVHTTHGKDMLQNFLTDVCQVSRDWTPASFVHETIDKLRERIGSEHVLLGISGGVDSSVAAMLLKEAIGDRLHAVFVDNGLLRKNEFEEVTALLGGLGINLHPVQATDIFLDRLAGVSDPERKRKIIGNTFIDVFEAEAAKLGEIKYLAQGTLYPDVIESVSPLGGPSVTIKSHHNVGGLKDRMAMKLVEPLRELFKDEVRRVGTELGLPDQFLDRHPFPGPGLGVRILGDITAERLRLLRDCDDIFITELHKHRLYNEVWQAFVVLLPVQAVGVMGDERTYEQVVALRAVTSVDGMTADWAVLPSEFLAHVSNRIINEVRGVNRVTYDISSKPPATIEWE